jgi:hypothetical protein
MDKGSDFHGIRELVKELVILPISKARGRKNAA